MGSPTTCEWLLKSGPVYPVVALTVGKIAGGDPTGEQPRMGHGTRIGGGARHQRIRRFGRRREGLHGGLLPDDFPPTRGVVGAEWWRAVEGADWRHPYGPHSDLVGLGDHPVVHVSWEEASTYAAWVGGRLPTETEWERAARGGLDQAVYAWGDELTPRGEHRCNIWQGEFPARNTLDDGYLGTSPVGAYPANDWGLHDVAGNVWEWCADDFADRPHHKVIRGGSYLCHESYCNRYRVGARSSNTLDTATGNMGFRVAFAF